MKILFISGSTILILTTLILMVVIPKYNSRIDDLTKRISGLADTIKEKEFQFRDFQNGEAIVANIRSTLMLFESLNLQQSEAYNKLKKEMYSTRLNSLAILAAAADMAKNHDEMNKLSEQWKTKPFDDLGKIQINYSVSLSKKLTKNLADQKALEEKYKKEVGTRNMINLVGGLFQGIALFLLAWSEYLLSFKK